MKLKVAVPCRDQVHTGFFHDAACAIATAAAAGIEVKVTTLAGTLICDQREQLAESAIKDECDWIMWFDSDMRFPSDVILRFLQRSVPIVAANYTSRRPPAEPITFKRLATHEKVYTTPESEGLEEVAAAGMGVMLTHVSVFKAMPKPWFLIPYVKEGNGYMGEDVWFCNQARKHGFPTFIDHDVSFDVKHIGLREYDYVDALAMREEIEAAKARQEQ